MSLNESLSPAAAPSSRAGYRIAIVTALLIERVAVELCLEPIWKVDYGSPRRDHQVYTYGRVGQHDVVVISLVGGVYGQTAAAVVVSQLLRSHSNVTDVIMVGVGGGIPHLPDKHDIRLGDVVVSQGPVWQFDYGKLEKDGSIRSTGQLPPPAQRFLALLAGLRARDQREHTLTIPLKHLCETLPNKLPNIQTRQTYMRPDPSSDLLYDSDGPNCQVVKRAEREDPAQPYIHYGVIASSHAVLKNGNKRNSLRDYTLHGDVLCVEMEAAGVAQGSLSYGQYLVIRGICDYADSHKAKQWQGHAAMAAAAFSKLLLQHLSASAEDMLPDLQSELKSALEYLLQMKEGFKAVRRDSVSSDNDVSDMLVSLGSDPDDVEEFNSIRNFVASAFAVGDGRRLVVEKVEVIHNVKLERKFNACRAKLSSSASTLLFHGTAEESIASIIKSGFRVPDPGATHGDNPLWFGSGIYFAPLASESDRYSQGGCKMLICDVALGRSLELTQRDIGFSLERLQMTGYDSIHSSLGSDTTLPVADEPRRHEFVVYRTEQALPKYVISYRTLPILRTDPMVAAHTKLSKHLNDNVPLVKFDIAKQGHMLQQLIDPTDDSELEQCLIHLGDCLRDDHENSHKLATKARLLKLLETILQDSDETQEGIPWAALRCLCNFCYADHTARELCRAAGTVTLVAKYLDGCSERIQEKSAATLCNLLIEDDIDYEIDSGTGGMLYSKLEQAIISITQNVGFTRMSQLSALTNLMRYRMYQQRACQSDSLYKAVRRLFNEHASKSESWSEMCCLAAVRLSQDPYIRQLLCGQGLIRIICKSLNYSMLRSDRPDSLLSIGFAALGTLSDGNADGLNCVARGGMVECMRGLSRDVRRQNECCYIHNMLLLCYSLLSSKEAVNFMRRPPSLHPYLWSIFSSLTSNRLEARGSCAAVLLHSAMQEQLHALNLPQNEVREIQTALNLFESREDTGLHWQIDISTVRAL